MTDRSDYIDFDITNVIIISVGKFRVRKTVITQPDVQLEIGDTLHTRFYPTGTALPFFTKTTKCIDVQISIWSDIGTFNNASDHSGMSFSLNDGYGINLPVASTCSPTTNWLFFMSYENFKFPHYIISPSVPEGYPGLEVIPYLTSRFTADAIVPVTSYLIWEFDLVFEDTAYYLLSTNDLNTLETNISGVIKTTD